jgi:hypothetical protein
MKAIILILFIIGLISITIGYVENYKDCPPTQIEYRFIPRNFYEEQVSSVNLKNFYSDMFNAPSVWEQYPFKVNTSENFDARNYGNFISEKSI